MAYFFETSETIPEGLGFDAYGSLHLSWLLCFAATVFAVSLIFRHHTEEKRIRLLRMLGITIFVSEIVRDSILIIGGNFAIDCLPLHLCGINIFIILAYVIKPREVLAEYLFAVCMPGALAALLFPSWTPLPITAFCHIHSFVFHIWIFLFPFLLLVGGFKPSFKRLWHSIPYALPAVVFVYIFNKIFGTDYMFLNGGGEGNPIAYFAGILGDPLYIITIPFLIGIVWSVMYGVPYLFKKAFLNKKSAEKAENKPEYQAEAL